MKRLLLLLLLATRLTGASQSDPITITSIAPAARITWPGEAPAINGALCITWTGGIPPYKLQIIEDVKGYWYDASYHIYTNSYVVSNALPQAYYRVRSIPDRTPPPALKGFGPRHINCRTVRFSWDPLQPDVYGGTGLRGTRIYRDGAFLVEIPFPMVVFIDTTVAEGTAYTYWASAVDAAGNESARSGTRAVETLSCDLHATLAWDANPEPDIAGYRLHYGTKSGKYTTILDVGPVTWREVTGLVSGTTYYFVVTAYNASALESVYSEEIVYTP